MGGIKKTALEDLKVFLKTVIMQTQTGFIWWEQPQQQLDLVFYLSRWSRRSANLAEFWFKKNHYHLAQVKLMFLQVCSSKMKRWRKETIKPLVAYEMQLVHMCVLIGKSRICVIFEICHLRYHCTLDNISLLSLTQT